MSDIETECIGEYVVYIYKPKGNDECLEGMCRVYANSEKNAIELVKFTINDSSKYKYESYKNDVLTGKEND